MKLRKILEKIFPRIILYIIVAIPVYVIFLYFFVLEAGPTPISIIMAAATALMLMGQFSAVSDYSFAYWLYYVSCFVSIALALFLWMSSHFPLFDVYLIILSALFLSIHLFHIRTRKWLKTFHAFQFLSLFLFGLLIVLSTGEIAAQTYDLMFGLTMILFIFVTIQMLNRTYHSRVLNENLKISSVEEYTTKCERMLLNKFKTETSDVDLLVYYLRSSFEHFIEGNFFRSFVDAYKIVFDEDGKAFKRIYILVDAKERMKKYSRIRAVLAHAKGRGAKLPEIKEVRRKLFDETIDLLKIVKTDFIEACLSS